MRKQETIKEYYKNNTLDKIVIKKQKAQEVDLINIGKNMTKLLNEIPDIDEMTHVIMENQISPIATRMKTIQGMLAQYFIMKCPLSTIEFISSANKLKGFLPKDVSGAQGYKENKKNSIMYCLKTIEANLFFQEWIERIKEHKKQDDLFDACLQGIWYLKNKQIIVYDDKFLISII